MTSISRFDCASSSLTLKSLLRKGQRMLWICFGLGIATHLSFTQLRGLETQQKTVKPLTTQFVKRQPRLTKPLELKKRPQPKRRRIQRTMVSVKARIDRTEATSGFQPTLMVRSLAQPGADVARTATFTDLGMEPQTLARVIQETKEFEQKVDMSLELLNIDALDTGQYHALAVQDPHDKRNVKGFLHLAVVYSRSMYPPKYPKFEVWIGPAMPRLAQAMNKYTDVRTDILGKFSLDSAEIFKAPWLYFMAFWPFVLTDSEMDNLGRYMLAGGFVFADSRYGHIPWRGGALSVSSSILKSLAMQGFELFYEKLPSSHPMYHCYFDFDCPPAAGDSTWPENITCGVFTYLEGVTLEQRLLAVFSKKGYYQPWAAWNAVMDRRDNNRTFQFAVNTIIFALTQEGSITHRLLESVRY